MHEIPDELVVNTTKYKMLQTQFNLLFNDAQTVGNISLCYHKKFGQGWLLSFNEYKMLYHQLTLGHGDESKGIKNPLPGSYVSCVFCLMYSIKPGLPKYWHDNYEKKL